jgi:hypothetical protein
VLSQISDDDYIQASWIFVIIKLTQQREPYMIHCVNSLLTSHMQFPVDVQELQMPPLATMHRQAMNRRIPGDTVDGMMERQVLCQSFDGNK